MTNPILLTLDGTTKDELALAIIVPVLELWDAPLRLVRVADGRHEETAQAAIAAMADELGASLGRPVEADVLVADDVASAIVRHAAERQAQLVVMATRAPGTVERALRGSVADRVMREGASPVLLVPPGIADLGGRRQPFARILVPLDGSALAARTVEYLLGLPRAAGLEYLLVEVVPREDDRPAALARLADAARRLQAVGARVVEFDVAVASDPAPAIVGAIREAFPDMIAMSSRGTSGARRLALGSVAEGVVRQSEVPVLLLTPASLAGA